MERQSYLIEAEREYRQIAELLKLKRTHKLGLDAFIAFHRDFPDFDPDHLVEKYSVNGFSAHTVNLAVPRESRDQTDFTLPLLEWCPVPTGLVELLDQDEAGQRRVRRVEVAAFQISKYPITNKQYQTFIDDPQGYMNPVWWQFAPQAQDWHMNNPAPKTPRFKGDERPRETINWYEAGAFCQWLSSRTGSTVRLPTTAEWQRACQGDDSRHYPWGNTFDQENCNTAESNLKMTTLVTRYTHGVSPYGVYDLAGNVWEWCLDGPPIADNQTHEGKKYFVRGGSHISPYQRAHAAFRYTLAPEIYHSSIGFRVVRV
ncbi:MAG TPA: SUMF1/EgtB/PvdO family nonheme iron enzyme [Phototrophicaceae bacterium]|nr:SUMF1/EgtB/PvdO family nonheme iron enzyme [Phototrophicaceae bacterium]